MEYLPKLSVMRISHPGICADRRGRPSLPSPRPALPLYG